MDFLLVLIELFSLGVTAEAPRAIICSKSAISLQRGPVDPKFQVEGVALPRNHSFSQKTRLNDLSYDRQTDGRTNRRTDVTEFSSHPCSAVKTSDAAMFVCSHATVYFFLFLCLCLYTVTKSRSAVIRRQTLFRQPLFRQGIGVARGYSECTCIPKAEKKNSGVIYRKNL